MKSLKKLEPAKIENTHQIRGGKYWDTITTFNDGNGNSHDIQDHDCPDGTLKFRN